MNPEYIEIFGHRGHPYHAAMRAFPSARACEFEQLFSDFPLSGETTLLDVPAGGGYLAEHLGDRARVTSLELTEGFSGGIRVASPAQLRSLNGFDRVVCLAALHHFEDQESFLRTLRDTVRPGGLLHIADVAAGSCLCGFLDGFVGAHNATGHRGRYLAANAHAYESLGVVARCEELACPWHFASESDMLSFCSSLFGLVDCPPQALSDALHSMIGVREVATGGIVLDWRLLYVDVICPGPVA